MHVEDLGRILDEHPFLSGLAPELRTLLVGCAANERYEAGQYIYREGQAAEKFWLLRRGTVSIEIYAPGREPLVVETIGEGDILGWSWLVPPHKAMFDARAVSLVRAVSFDAKCLLRKMESDHALGYEVMKRFVPVVAHRLQAARLQMLDLYGPGGGGRRSA